MLLNYLAVMAGGAVGVAVRMFISMWVTERSDSTFPLAILLVNVLGCAAIGIFTGLTTANGALVVSPLLRQVVIVGVLGGFTTFSSFSIQTISLLTNGEWFYAFANIVLSVILCLAATWGGMAVAGLWQTR